MCGLICALMIGFCLVLLSRSALKEIPRASVVVEDPRALSGAAFSCGASSNSPALAGAKKESK